MIARFPVSVNRLLPKPMLRAEMFALLQTDSADRVIEKQLNSRQIAVGAGLRVRLLSRFHLKPNTSTTTRIPSNSA